MLDRLLDLDKYYSIGLDVGASTVKMVQITRNGHGLVVNAAAAQEIETAASDDDAAKRAKVAAAIKSCYKNLNLKLRTRYVVCGVSGPEVAIRSFHLPSIPPDRLKAAIMNEAAEVCPFNVRQNCFDYQLATPGTTPESKDQHSSEVNTGVMVAATNMVVNSKKTLVEEAGLTCALIDVNGLAMVNLFHECEKQPVGRTIALVNVRNSWINLAIISDSTLPFIRDFNYGGRDIVSRIAEDTGMSADVVRGVLAKRNTDPSLRQRVTEAMKNGCVRLAKDISETLRYHMTQEKSGPVDAAYVCGGFALADGFVESLGGLFNHPVRLWNPFRNMKIDGSLNFLAERGPAFAVAAGLGMRSI